MYHTDTQKTIIKIVCTKNLQHLFKLTENAFIIYTTQFCNKLLSPATF